VDIRSVKGMDNLGDGSGEPVAVVVRGIIAKYAGRKKGDFWCVWEMKVCERNLDWSGKRQDG
jgi:predicted hydrocarbon binding protein